MHGSLVQGPSRQGDIQLNVSRIIPGLNAVKRFLSRFVQEFLYLVGPFAGCRPFFRGEPGYISQETGDEPFSAKIFDTDLVYRVSTRGGHEFREALFLNPVY
jgi:hypothetical protein